MQLVSFFYKHNSQQLIDYFLNILKDMHWDKYTLSWNKLHQTSCELIRIKQPKKEKVGAAEVDTKKHTPLKNTFKLVIVHT